MTELLHVHNTRFDATKVIGVWNKFLQTTFPCRKSGGRRVVLYFGGWVIHLVGLSGSAIYVIYCVKQKLCRKKCTSRLEKEHSETRLRTKLLVAIWHSGQEERRSFSLPSFLLWLLKKGNNSNHLSKCFPLLLFFASTWLELSIWPGITFNSSTQVKSP